MILQRQMRKELYQENIPYDSTNVIPIPLAIVEKD